MKKSFLLLGLLALFAVTAMYASPYNIAAKSRVSASSVCSGEYDAENVTDQVIRIPGKGAWASKSTMTFWGQIDYPGYNWTGRHRYASIKSSCMTVRRKKYI